MTSSPSGPEPHSQFPPAGEPVRLVPSAADEDQARGDQGAHPKDQRATGSGQAGGGACPGHAQLPRGARDRRDVRVDGPAAEFTHRPLTVFTSAGEQPVRDSPVNHRHQTQR